MKSPTSTVKMTARQRAEIETGVKCVYLLDLPYVKVGQLRKHMETLKFHMKSIINLSYVGKQVVECLISDTDIRSFRLNARKHHIGLHENFNPMNIRNHTLDFWLSDLQHKTAQELCTDFIKRMAKEVAGSNNPLTSEFYRMWAIGLGESKRFYDNLRNIKTSVRVLAILANLFRKPQT